MLLGGGLITEALCSGGGSYANEPKTITANGEYKPPDNVRWDKVTVDVPAAQNYGEIFNEMSNCYGWTFCGGKWVILLKATEGFGTDLRGTSSFSYHTYESGGIIYSDLDSERKAQHCYLCLYKNGSKFEFICANEVYVTSDAEDYYYYGGTDSGITPYKVTEVTCKCTGVENGAYEIRNGGIVAALKLKGIVHFSKRTINRDYSTGEVIQDNTIDIKNSLDTYMDINGSVFSDLSIYDRYNAYIEFGKDLNSLII